MTQANMEPSLLVVNSLPDTLRHFEQELVESFQATQKLGFRGFVGEGPKTEASWKRLIAYLKFSRSVQRERRPILVLWPLLGWWDLVVWGFSGQKTSVMVHDPVPLRRQIGMDRFSRFATRLLLKVLRNIEVIVLSREAQAEVETLLPTASVRRFPHPLRRPSVDGGRSRRGRNLLVLGQYKPARDLQLLEDLAPHIPALGFTPVIRGRGWPSVPGWDVKNAFLTEEQFQQELDGAAALLVPYKHYFQSNVAVRALESGVPVVGVGTDFLVALVGPEAPTLVADDRLDSWLTAIANADSARREAADPEVWQRVSSAWATY